MAHLEQPLQEIIIVDSRSEDYGALHASLAYNLAIDAQLRICTTGGEALRLASSARPALWLINAELPDMTGAELYALLRPRLRGKPAFLVADSYDPAHEIAAMQSGGLHFVCKPLPVDWLGAVWADVTRRAAPTLTPAPLSDMHSPVAGGVWPMLSPVSPSFTHP